MPRVKLHRPTSPDDRPQAPPDEFEAGLFPEIAPEPAKPEKPKYEAWPTMYRQSLSMSGPHTFLT